MKFVTTRILMSTMRRLILIIAVSIVVKRELVNETVNYDTKTKAYIPILPRTQWAHRFDIEILLRKFVDILLVMKGESA